MKLHNRVAALAVTLSGCLLVPHAGATTINIGSGPETSFFVLESPNLGSREYNIHYGGGLTPVPLDGFDLFSLVLAAEPEITAVIFNFGSLETPNYFVNSITFDGVTETNTGADPYVPSWIQWVAGGETGFPTASPIANDTWVGGSGISAPYRLVAPGSSDALVFADFVTPPSVNPIPEPGVTVLLCAAIIAVGTRRKRTH